MIKELVSLLGACTQEVRRREGLHSINIGRIVRIDLKYTLSYHSKNVDHVCHGKGVVNELVSLLGAYTYRVRQRDALHS